MASSVVLVFCIRYGFSTEIIRV